MIVAMSAPGLFGQGKGKGKNKDKKYDMNLRILEGDNESNEKDDHLPDSAKTGGDDVWIAEPNEVVNWLLDSR